MVDGKVSVVGVPGQSVKLGELAAKANPMRGAVKPGTEPGLEATQYFGPDRGATASGVHAMIVEVDPETFTLEVLKYVVVHDCGTRDQPADPGRARFTAASRRASATPSTSSWSSTRTGSC